MKRAVVEKSPSKLALAFLTGSNQRQGVVLPSVKHHSKTKSEAVDKQKMQRARNKLSSFFDQSLKAEPSVSTLINTTAIEADAHLQQEKAEQLKNCAGTNLTTFVRESESTSPRSGSRT